MQLTVRPEVEASIIKKCWQDEQYKARFLANPTETFKKEMASIDSSAKVPAGFEVRVLQETDTQLYLVVTGEPTHGASPALNERSTRLDFEAALVQKAWDDAAFKRTLLADPKAAYEAQLGTIKKGAKLPDAIKVKAVEEAQAFIYLRIPQRPTHLAGVELNDAELEQVAGGVVAVGVAIASYVTVGVVAAAVLLVQEA